MPIFIIIGLMSLFFLVFCFCLCSLNLSLALSFHLLLSTSHSLAFICAGVFTPAQIKVRGLPSNLFDDFDSVLFHAVFFLEFLRSSATLNRFLLACKEGVAFRTNFHSYLFFSGSRFKRVSASTSDGSCLIFRMYS